MFGCCVMRPAFIRINFEAASVSFRYLVVNRQNLKLVFSNHTTPVKVDFFYMVF